MGEYRCGGLLLEARAKEFAGVASIMRSESEIPARRKSQGFGSNLPKVTLARPETNAIYTGPGGSRPTGWWSARNR